MITGIPTLALFAALAFSQSVPGKECWALTNLVGYMAASSDNYRFQTDKFSSPMLLCFDKTTGTVSGDDTSLTRFGSSTLAGWGATKGIELFVVYQVDRAKNKILFTKSRIGTNTAIPGAPDIIGAFVGDAVMITK